MASRSRYWSCSKFADWLRGTPKPYAESSKGWRLWEQQAKSAHKIRFWLAEEALDAIQNFINWPIDQLYDIKYYINNRWITRTHCLVADRDQIRPGDWCDFGDRILPSVFGSFVDYVECELAWANFRWDEEARKKHNVPWWASGRWRIRTYRNAAAAMDYLQWAKTLVDDDGKPTHQAKVAAETEELYNWWKYARPTRPEPMDKSGWTAYCDRNREDGLGLLDRDESPEERAEVKKMLDMMRRLELQYEREDEKMLMRLIRIRNSLWT